VESVGEDLKTLPTGDQNFEDAVLKKQLEAFVEAEGKRIKIRHCLMEKRLARVDNILKRFYKEKNAAKNKTVFDSLKDRLLEEVKVTTVDNPAVEEAEPAVKTAEQEMELVKSVQNKSVEEMLEVADSIASAISIAQSALDFAQQEICPIDAGVDEDVKIQLRAAAAQFLRKPLAKLGLLEQRLLRITTAFSLFKKEIAHRRQAESAATKAIVGRLLRHHMSTYDLAPEGFLEKVSDELDKRSFTALVESLDKNVPRQGGKPGEEMLEVSEGAVSELFDCLDSEGCGVLDQEVFLGLLRQVMRVARGTTMSTAICLSQSKIVRTLKPGEVVTVLEGPIHEEKSGLTRVRVRVEGDGKEGWASVAGNAGSVFLTECN